jgi:hypothetical protein
MLQDSRQKSSSTATRRRRAGPLVAWPVRRALLSAARPLELKVREVLFHAGDPGRAATSCVKVS